MSFVEAKHLEKLHHGISFYEIHKVVSFRAVF